MSNTNTNDPGEAAVPAGYRLGDGWEVYGAAMCTVGPKDKLSCREFPIYYNRGKAACPAHAVEMGALVPIEPTVAEPPVDWSRFVPTEPLPELPDDDEWSAHHLSHGTVFASWSEESGGSVRVRGLRLAGAEVWDSGRFVVIRHADGRWAEGYGPGGPIPAASVAESPGFRPQIPVCHPKCGTKECPAKHGGKCVTPCGPKGQHWCTALCRDLGRPLNPPATAAPVAEPERPVCRGCGCSDYHGRGCPVGNWGCELNPPPAEVPPCPVPPEGEPVLLDVTIEVMPIDTGTGTAEPPAQPTRGCGVAIPPWKCGETMPSGVVAQCERCAGTGAVTTGEATKPMGSIGRALKRVPLWDAVNRVVVASGGNDGNTSFARQQAVVEVERAVDALLADAIKAAIASERERVRQGWEAFLDSRMSLGAFRDFLTSGAGAPGAGK